MPNQFNNKKYCNNTKSNHERFQRLHETYKDCKKLYVYQNPDGTLFYEFGWMLPPINDALHRPYSNNPISIEHVEYFVRNARYDGGAIAFVGNCLADNDKVWGYQLYAGNNFDLENKDRDLDPVFAYSEAGLCTGAKSSELCALEAVCNKAVELGLSKLTIVSNDFNLASNTLGLYTKKVLRKHKLHRWYESFRDEYEARNGKKFILHFRYFYAKKVKDTFMYRGSQKVQKYINSETSEHLDEWKAELLAKQEAERKQQEAKRAELYAKQNAEWERLVEEGISLDDIIGIPF